MTAAGLWLYEWLSNSAVVQIISGTIMYHEVTEQIPPREITVEFHKSKVYFYQLNKRKKNGYMGSIYRIRKHNTPSLSNSEIW